jgi:hypothetical protein
MQIVDCVPIGGSIGQLRPVNLALPLLDMAELELGAPPREGLDKSAFPVKTGPEGAHRWQRETEGPSPDLVRILPSRIHDPSGAPSFCARRSSIAVISAPWEATIADARART